MSENFEKIKRIVKAKGLTISDLARGTFIPERTLFNWFSGKTKPNNSMLALFVSQLKDNMNVRVR